jgi:hypothetical protein
MPELRGLLKLPFGYISVFRSGSTRTEASRRIAPNDRTIRVASPAACAMHYAFGNTACLAVLVLSLMISASAQSASQTAPPAAQKQLTLDGAFSTERTFPVISNGYLISFSRVGASGNPISIVLHSLQTGNQQQILFSLPNASKVTLLDAAVSTGFNGIVVAGSYLLSGAGEEQAFLGQVDFFGTVTSIVPLGAYTPERVCAASDSTYWTFGQQLSDEGSIGTGNSYDMIRNYALDGSLKRSYLLRAALSPAVLDFHPAGAVFGYGVNLAALSCGSSSVGVYLGNPVRTWFEVSYKTGQSKQSIIKALPGSVMTNLTLTSPGSVYASFALPPRNSGANSGPGLYLLSLGSAGPGSWAKLPDSQDVPIPSRLLGQDNGQLVYLTGQSKPVTPVLYWSQP